MDRPDAARRPPFWELKQEAARPSVLQLYVYGYVESDYYTIWGDRIESETSAEHFREALAAFPDVTEIEIYINSLGGSVVEGTAIYNQLKRHAAHKTVFVDGFAGSIASVIAMAGDDVVMPANTLMMIHNMAWGVWGNPAQLRKAAEDLEIINNTGREAYLLKAGDKLTPERLAEMMDAETWLPARECVELGLADRIADEPAQNAAEGEAAPQQRTGMLSLAARAMGFDALAARVTEAEARAAKAEAALREAQKAAAASPDTAAAQRAEAPAAPAMGAEKAENAEPPRMSIMAALCGMK